MVPLAAAADDDPLELVEESERELLHAARPVVNTATATVARSFFFDNSTFLPR